MEHQYNNTLPPAVNVSPEPPDIQAKKKSPMREDAKPYKGRPLAYLRGDPVVVREGVAAESRLTAGGR